MGKQLVLIGGGHAHMVTLANLREIIANGHHVTVVGPSEYHYYSGMGPGMLAKIYAPDDIRFATRDVVQKQGGTFVLGKVIRIEADKKSVLLESGDSIPYDVLSCNVGSYVPANMVAEATADVYFVKPIEKLIEAQKRIVSLSSRKQITIGVVGGGPSAVEIAGCTWRLVKDHGRHPPNIKIFAGRKIMSAFPAKVREKAIRSLTKRGIEILEHRYVAEIKTGQVFTDSGQSHRLDVIFVAVGIKPSPIFKNSGLPTGSDEALLVNEYLQCTQYPEIFGGGDCIYFKDQPLDKVGVYAVRENPILYHNLQAALEGRALQAFDPGGEYLLIFNLGDGTGIFHKKGLTFGGKPAFMVKDHIDRKFMKKFQAIE